MKEGKWNRSVVSDSLWPHGLQPTRLLHPWNFLGRSPGVGCHFLLQGVFLTQGLNLGFPHCRQRVYHLCHQGILNESEPTANLGGRTSFFTSVSQSVQSLSRVRLFATPWITARQVSLSITNSRSSLKLTFFISVILKSTPSTLSLFQPHFPWEWQQAGEWMTRQAYGSLPPIRLPCSTRVLWTLKRS